ncbi:MAG TPA: amidohydrolase family protein [Jiangellales bacterium]|nr:amidohydrolase family protein [Jiangellales bacterium]
MALVVRGRVVPLSGDPSLSPEPMTAFRGRVWIGDDGLVAAVTRGTRAGPPGFADAPRVDVGDDLVLPGLVDLHNHLAYDTLPLWVEPRQQEPFLHHNSWPRARSYAASVTWPAYAFVTAAPEELLAYVETKAIVGGTTTVQGSPPKNRPRDGWLVRNVEDETFGTGNANLVYAATLTLKPAVLADRANKMRAGSTFIYHCAEGQPGSVVAREFGDAADAGCLQPHFVAVHCCAADRTAFERWRTAGGAGAVVWSPFSNLWLYGTTTDVPAARAAGITVCLGSDWAPSGTKHVLGEIKVARLAADAHGWALSDADLVQMVTSDAGDVLRRGWGRQVGRLQPGAIGDVLVVAAGRGADPAATVVAATERDVRLVVVDGRPRYGEPALMAQAGAVGCTRLTVAGEIRHLALHRPGDETAPWEWTDVVDRLEEVRADPKGQIEQGLGRLAAWAGPLDDRGAPLRLALDMPTGLSPVGGLPKDLGQVVVPPLESLSHDEAWLTALHGRGFHADLLDGLARYYS